MLDQLTKLLPPPKRPVDRPNRHRRKQVEHASGTPLPDDYWEFGCLYGSGYFPVGPSIYNPTAENYLSSMRWAFYELRVWKEFGYWKERKQIKPGYPVFPEQPGLLPWGSDEGNAAFSWLWDAKVAPSSWRIVAIRDCDSVEELRMTFSELMVRALTKKLRSKLWIMKGETTFIPHKNTLIFPAVAASTNTPKKRRK